MIWTVVSFVAGIVFLQYQAELPALVWAGLIPFLLTTMHLRRFRWPVFFCLGFLWALLHAHWMLSSSLDPALEGEDVQLEGIVASLPEQLGPRMRFLFEVEKLEHQGTSYPSPGRVRLGWYRNAPVLNVGEHWRLQVRLRRPHGFMNPGGFDYEDSLYQLNLISA